MRLEHHLVGGYVRYISPYIIIIINHRSSTLQHLHIQTKSIITAQTWSHGQFDLSREITNSVKNYQIWTFDVSF